MDVVIQCAATKDPTAGRLKTGDGRDVHFVAAPELCSSVAGTLYTRPDDNSDLPGLTWRDRLERYVDQEKYNPLELRQARVPRGKRVSPGKGATPCRTIAGVI